MRQPVSQDLVLVGGGHSHVAVLRSFGMRPLPGLRITLISRRSLTPYSGMLPGLVAGHYTADEAHIDLRPLCRFAGAGFVAAEVVGFDPEARTVRLDGRPEIGYDWLSIDTGSTPTALPVAGDDGGPTPVKPIDRFLARWEALVARLGARAGPSRIAVIGGGAGGVELSLAISYRLRTLGHDAQLALLTAEPELLTSHPPGVRRRFGRLLAERGIEVRVSARVTAAGRRRVEIESGEALAFDEVLSVTHASAPAWVAAAGVATDDRGFLLVDRCLRSVSHAGVFAAGDVAEMRNSPRPKSGVFAVRQGRPLAENLRRAALGRPLRAYRPQRRFLSLIGTGDGRAVASRGPWSAEGAWVWRWKDRIDRRFMRRYEDLPAMSDRGTRDAPERLPEYRPPGAPADGMRCGGCGAKVGAETLARVLARIDAHARDDVVLGLGGADDAAVLSGTPGRQQVLSVDAFRPMLDDLYVFGRVTANHCLNDVYAVGAEPQSALALVVLPVWPEPKRADALLQMLTGANDVLAEAGAALVGGHTGEGEELSLGFSVTGLVEPGALLTKAGLAAGDRLILTKPLGTGALFAADMRAKAKGVWIDAALDVMQQSNRDAVRILRAHGARACTDVTGFGLLGHLLEMLRGASLGLELDVDALPALDGAVDVVARGWRSSLHAANERAAAGLGLDLDRHPSAPLLFDPQTAGGLVAGIPAPSADACVAALRAAGYTAAAAFAIVTPNSGTVTLFPR